MPLDPDVANLLSYIESAGFPVVADSTPEVARMGLRALMVDFRDPETLVPVASVEAVRLAGDIPARVYRPDDTPGAIPSIVYLHGGGFVIGDLDTHENVARRLCRDVGAVVISVDYPLAPEHPFPAAVDTAYNALRWVYENVDDFGGDAARVAVGGDSAGANLAAVCAQQARADEIPLGAQLLVYPNVDLLGDYPSRTENAEGYFLTLRDMEWFAAQYIGVAGGAAAAWDDPAAVDLARDPRLSPLLADSLTGLAPAVVATAEFDPLRDEGDRYAAALAEAGVPVVHRQFPGLIHGFYGLEEISPAIAAATAWVNEQLRDLLH